MKTIRKIAKVFAFISAGGALLSAVTMQWAFFENLVFYAFGCIITMILADWFEEAKENQTRQTEILAEIRHMLKKNNPNDKNE